MKLTIEEFSSIFCIGEQSSSTTEEGTLCCGISSYKGLEYYNIICTLDMLRRMFSKGFINAVIKIFFTHMENGFASKKKVMCFVLSRCMKLSETPTLFSFLLVCNLVREIIFCVFNVLEIECFTVAKIASKCLIAAYYRRYVDLWDNENGFEGLNNYCQKLNETILYSSNEASETESERIPVNLEGFNPPNTDGLIDLLTSLNSVQDADFELTDFEKKLLYDRDSLSTNIDASEDIFIQFDGSSEWNRIHELDIPLQNLNVKSSHSLEFLREICPLCKDNCYKHVVFAAKELKVDELYVYVG